MQRQKGGVYNLLFDDFELSDVIEFFDKDENEALTRMISWGLRHGGGVNFAYEQLMKSEGTVVSFSRAIARTLKKYITVEKLSNMCDECGEPDGLVMAENCYKCKYCGASKCE
jgi:ribonucleoside-diphosphate reductase alpha chain